MPPKPGRPQANPEFLRLQGLAKARIRRRGVRKRNIRKEPTALEDYSGGRNEVLSKHPGCAGPEFDPEYLKHSRKK